MAKIQVAVINVEGDNDTLKEAMLMAGDLIAQRSAPSATVELAAAPAAALPAAAPVKKTAGTFYCKQCPETFDSVGKVAAHTRVTHPKAPKKSDLSEGAEMNGQIWCPQKNCGRSFHKRGWLNIHLEKDHGVSL